MSFNSCNARFRSIWIQRLDLEDIRIRKKLIDCIINWKGILLFTCHVVFPVCHVICTFHVMLHVTSHIIYINNMTLHVTWHLMTWHKSSDRPDTNFYVLQNKVDFRKNNKFFWTKMDMYVNICQNMFNKRFCYVLFSQSEFWLYVTIL